MHDAIRSAPSAHGVVDALAASLRDPVDGVDLVYEVLDWLVADHGLRDAHLVVRVEAIAGLAGAQIFRRGRLPVDPATASELLERPTGITTEPDVVEPSTRNALAGICTAALATQAGRRLAAVDPTCGLAGRGAIDAALARAAARAARHGWATTAVLLATDGAGEPTERWLALCAALRHALRVGDEAGVAGGGRALAILSAAGPDVVRPFVARVRAALSAAGHEGLDLAAATASAPRESVDPAELWQLAFERLGEMRGPRRSDAAITASTVELELRALPGVVSVGVRPRAADGAGRVDVVAVSPRSPLEASARHRVQEWEAGAELHVATVTLHDDHGHARHEPPPRASGPPAANDTFEASAASTAGAAVGQSGHAPDARGNGHSTPGAGPASAPRQLSANGSAGGHEAPGARRVRLLAATFDPRTGVSEVRLARGGARGTGRAPAGPLAGGAQATLTALGGLGVDVPFYLVSAERARGVPGDPVVVVLAPRQRSAAEPPPGERIGVAAGDDAEAAGRATLAALNRYLATSTAFMAHPAADEHR